MTDPAPSAERHRRRRLPILLATLVALGAAQAAAWLYFRKSQPVTDEITRDRLGPKGRS